MQAVGVVIHAIMQEQVGAGMVEDSMDRHPKKL
jgi:hypothetical protein